MELLRPDKDTEVLLRYNHSAYAAYAAATCHAYGNGKAAYIGTMPDSAALDALLEGLLPRMGIGLLPYRWPLIVKDGKNDDGKDVRFLLNYSDGAREYRTEESGMELLSQRETSSGETLRLEPWGTAVLL